MIVLLPVIVAACEPTPEWNGSLESLLMSQPDRFAGVMQSPEKFRLQIVYTQIDRDSDNRPSFRTFSYRLDPTEYFYPASTVKLPTVALALEKLNLLERPGLDMHTTMLTGSAAEYQTTVLVDETSPTGLPSVANYARKILLVSDNDAFNRLYEFIGQEEINTSLQDKGYTDTRIVHRLERTLDKSQNQWTNPVEFMIGDEMIYQQEAKRTGIDYYGNKPQPLGRAEIVNGELLARPKDFSEKNAYALLDQHEVIKNLMFPQSADQKQRFNLSDDDYRFIYNYMSMYPTESDIELYDDINKYPQGYVKFLMYGGDAMQIPSHIRIFNKVGDAYGFLTDSAYIIDFKNNVEFLLSATIYTNENQTFNDNNYEYNEIALPFLRNLGQSIYEIELKRPRQNEPDLSRYRIPGRDY